MLCLRLLVTPWTAGHQAPLSMGFSRLEYWSALPWPSPGHLLDPGMEPTSLASPALAGGFFTTSAMWGAATRCFMSSASTCPLACCPPLSTRPLLVRQTEFFLCLLSSLTRSGERQVVFCMWGWRRWGDWKRKSAQRAQPGPAPEQGIRCYQSCSCGMRCEPEDFQVSRSIHLEFPHVSSN